MMVSSIDDLVRLTEQDVLRLKNVGRKTADEIIDVLRRMRPLEPPGPDAEGTAGATDGDRPLAAPTALSGPGPLPPDPEVLFDRLSARARNALLRLKVSSAHDAVRLNKRDLIAARNVGQKTAAEILTLLRSIAESDYAKAARHLAAQVAPDPAPASAPTFSERLSSPPPDSVLATSVARHATRGGSVEQLGIHELMSLSVEEASCRWQLDDTFWFDMQRLLASHGIEFNWESRNHRLGLPPIPKFVEDELALVLSVIPTPANRPKVAAYFGWDGGRGLNLREVGERFGTSRENIRQIKARIESDARLRARPWPLTERAIAMIAALAPCSVQEAELRLGKAALLRGTLSTEGLMNAANVLGIAVPFELLEDENSILVPTELGSAPARLRTIAVRATRNHGAASLNEVLDTFATEFPNSSLGADSAITLLEAFRGFAWLDSNHEWFWFADGRGNRLINQIRKVLAVTGTIDISELHNAVSRHYHLAGTAPPLRVITEVCRQSPGFRVAEREVSTLDPLSVSEELNESEREYFHLIRNSERVFTRPEAEDELVRRGLSLPTATALLQYSPIVKRFTHNAYGLVGDQPGELGTRREKVRRRRHDAEYTWLDSGRIRLRFSVNRSVWATGVVSIPGPIRSFVSGKFRIIDQRGREVGVLRCGEKSCAWGLGRFFRLNENTGDILSLTFDLAGRVVLGAMESKNEDSDQHE